VGRTGHRSEGKIAEAVLDESLTHARRFFRV
jgi:hypothetical protein